MALKEFYPQQYARRTETGRVGPKSGSEKIFQIDLELFEIESNLLHGVAPITGIAAPTGYIQSELGGFHSMPLVDGESLLSRSDRRSLGEDEIAQLAAELLRLTDWLHAQGILHLDIKLHNVMFDRQGQVWLSDFGAAVRLDETAQRDEPFIITAGFAPPEQVWGEGEQVGVEADWYGVGATLHTCLADFRPPDSDYRHRLVHERREPDPLVEVGPLAPGMPQALLDAVRGCLSLERKARHQGVEALRTWLQERGQTERAGDAVVAARRAGDLACLEENWTQARDGYESGAQVGDLPCQLALAWIYDEGNTTLNDESAALEVYGKAADQGRPLALYRVFRILEEREETPLASAEKYLLKAADAGYLRAVREVARRWVEHEGSIDWEVGHDMLWRAARMGSVTSQYWLAEWLDDEERWEEKWRWMTHAAQGGRRRAQLELGLAYCSGAHGVVAVNPKQARRWLEKAWNNGLSEAAAPLADLLARGAGGACDFPRAIDLLSRIEKWSGSRAAYGMGMAYWRARRPHYDPFTARQWFEKAVERGSKPALLALGEMCQDGVGGEQDVERAARCFERAAEAGLFEGDYALGRLLEKLAQSGDDPRWAQAKGHYESAAGQGHEEAAKRLRKMAKKGDEWTRVEPRGKRKRRKK
ncbi:putative serine/threonine protein kinase [Magnetofaba australis IT-1]|uniref:Putative serine/threonine protein kinase n=1 Tax=Magnetofaba australis IT-1 TaxID=1434232 RepID=A0A1Y2K529_9PROT|nr:putative serine/threonine protein kinase [Magnetofaba australis IT-1]